MITPIKIMTIDEIVQRNNDMLMSVEDMKDLAIHERNSAIDEFVHELLNYKPQDEEYKSFEDICNEVANRLKT